MLSALFVSGLMGRMRLKFEKLRPVRLLVQ
jgi:hypothetical protein